MKRQATLRSSSSVRETADTSTVHHVANSVGCMAGVFSIISSKYRTRRKFLTFGRRQLKSSPTSKQNSPATKCRGENRDKNSDLKEAAREFRRLSCQVPRSPTIPLEIRRSNSLNSPESFRSPVPSVVARLMGLEDTPPPPVTVMPSPPPELAAEKRRKLLGALEKCDEDLQELKRIIEAVRTTDRSKSPASPALVSFGKVNGINEEQPSPVSVLDDFCDSPPPPTSSPGGRHSSTKFTQIGRAPTLQLLQRKKPGEDNARLRVQRCLLHPKINTTFIISPSQTCGGDTMEKAVNEVCKDVETGQERETERLGAVFEDFIYRDLIEELTKDLLGRRCHTESSCFSFEKCKRRLCY